MKPGWILSCSFLISSFGTSIAQPGADRLKLALQSGNLKSIGLTQEKEVKEYYRLLNYTFSWTNEQNEYNRQILLDLLQNAAKAGLNRQDYQFEFIASLSQQSVLKTSEDSVITELKLSDAAIHFFSDFIHGNTRPALRYDGLNYVPSCTNIPQLLAACINNNQLCLLDKWEPQMQEIVLMRKKIEQLEGRLSSNGYKEEKIISAEVSHLNKPLLKKLYYLGISEFPGPASDKEIKEKVKEAQLTFNLMADGVLRSTILNELNVPLAARIKQLNLSINYYRWLYCLTREQTVILVNIPAAYMKVYDRSGVKLEMRMVVGQPSTPTPTLSSQVSEVILYPYWRVPHSIATKELLPRIKRNPGYINQNNFQIINSNGRVVDPYKIDWASVQPSSFPYIIRQSTGCDNALGLIKLEFYNPFSVYLHDTPLKNYFTYNKRYFSHGCMRMEKPMELGHLILKNNSIAIDTLTEKGCLYNQSPIVVKADETMPVVVWYNPVGTDSTGRVIFYEDVYRKFRLATN